MLRPCSVRSSGSHVNHAVGEAGNGFSPTGTECVFRAVKLTSKRCIATSRATEWFFGFCDGSVLLRWRNGQTGMYTVAHGPDIMDQAHNPDELITIDQLHACDTMLIQLVEYVCAEG